MFNFKSWIWLLIALWPVSVTALAKPPAVPKIPAIPHELETANDGQGTITIEESEIAITAQKGTDLFTDTKGKTHADNTPRVLFAPEGDFIFSAKVSTTFEKPYDGGALIVYADDQHWGKLLFERFKSGKNGIATTVANGAGDDAYHTTHDGSYQYLKVVRHGSSYVFYASEDGSDWNFLRHFSLHTGTPVKVGFMAQAPLSESLSVHFSEVAFRSKTLKDFWQGE